MSLYETINHGAARLFRCSVTLLFFLLIGRTLDHVMRDRARGAVIGLARLPPRGAIVLSTPMAAATIVPVERDRAGHAAPDRGRRARPGRRASSSDGASDLDCSLVTGESRAARDRAGRDGAGRHAQPDRPADARGDGAAAELLPRRDDCA